MKTNFQSGFATWILIIGGLMLLSAGVVVGKFLPQPQSSPELKPTPTPVLEVVTVTPEATPSVTTNVSNTGKISGYLIYPSDHIPPQVGVCAEQVDNSTIKTCVNQITDKKFAPTGVGYEMELPAGKYYVYSILGDWKAYYNEFVTCGLKAECKSHAKIAVEITAGSDNNKILPHDWYDTPAPTESVVVPTVKISIKPIVSLVPTIMKIDPNILKLIPTATPTKIKVVIPTVKINFGF
jgi:hypothetical protein